MHRAVTCGILTFAVVLVLHAAGPGSPLGLDLYRPIPDTNPLTREKVELGRRLFHELRLSRDGSRSCATCHDPRRAFTDGRAVSVGPAGEIGRRNVPTLVNRAWGTSFFWDGRATTLEQQASQPILNPLELGAAPDDVVALARSADYQRAFRRVVGSEPVLADVSRVLASYVRTIVSGDSSYDRYVAGRRSALSATARRGLSLFGGRAACSACHTGPNFTDEQFHNTGVAWRPTAGSKEISRPSDPGRSIVTGAEADRGAFKTPTLRDIARTSPYMHDGSLATLADVIAFYDRGGQRNSGLDHRLRPLHLSPQERNDLAVFLGTLTGRIDEGW